MEAIWLRCQSAMNVHELQNCKRMTVGTTSETGIDKTCSRDCHSRILRSQLRYDLGLQPQEPLDKLLGIQMTKNDLIPHWVLTDSSISSIYRHAFFYHHPFDSAFDSVPGGQWLSQANRQLRRWLKQRLLGKPCCRDAVLTCGHRAVNPSTVPHPWHQPVGARLSTLSPNRSPSTT